MFYIPSVYFHKVMVEKLPFYFASDREIFFNKVDQDLLDYWNQKNIRYDFNEHQFRTSYDFSKLKDGEFILVTGCSHTVGIGIDYDSMYTTILEKELDIPVVNIAIMSSDINVVLRNLAVWMKNFAKPKKIIIQIPEPSRFSYMFDPFEINTVVTSSGDPKDDFKLVETLGMRYYSTYEAGFNQLDFLQCIVSSYGIDTFYFSIGDMSEYRHLEFRQPIHYWLDVQERKTTVYKIRNPKMKLRARDGGHGGDLVNKIWADAVLEKLK